jgi:prepilin-type N-terminal cleavage/methylation domain-containing protein
MAAQQRPTSGFTLVELLVGLGVIAVLAALSVPVLSSVRMESKRTKSLTNIRTLGTVIQAYCEGNREYFPRPEQERWYETVDGARLKAPFWQAQCTWVAIARDYMPREGYKQLVRCPDSLESSGKAFPYTSYLYSWSFLSRPEVWRDEPIESSFTQAVKVADVSYPSRKALLWDDDAGYLGRRRHFVGSDLAAPVPVQFVDGSARVLKPSDATAPVVNVWAPSQHPSYVRRLLCTRDGVYGFDY